MHITHEGWVGTWRSGLAFCSSQRDADHPVQGRQQSSSAGTGSHRGPGGTEPEVPLSSSCCLCLYYYHAPDWEARFACTELVETCTRPFACGACAPCACTSPFQGAFCVRPGRAPGSCTGHSGPSGLSAVTGLGPRRSCLRSVTNRFFSRVGSEVPHFPENSDCDWGRGTATRVGGAVGGRCCLALRPGLWSPRLNSAPDGFQRPQSWSPGHAWM